MSKNKNMEFIETSATGNLSFISQGDLLNGLSGSTCIVTQNSLQELGKDLAVSIQECSEQVVIVEDINNTSLSSGTVIITTNKSEFIKAASNNIHCRYKLSKEERLKCRDGDPTFLSSLKREIENKNI